jgi:zinc transport system substrate-binding protein
LATIWVVAAAVLGFPGTGRAEAPQVVVSVQPIHALVSGVMNRVAIPDLLVRRGASPYDFKLRASLRRKLAEADLVVWVGGGLDDFMVEAIADLPPTTRVIKITDLGLPVTLPLRTTGLWRKDDPAAGARIDPHVWLDPDNATAIVDIVARALTEIDRLHKIDYSRNREIVGSRLGGLHRQLRLALDRYGDIPFVVQHDAFQYLEQRYGLEIIGALMTGTADGGMPPPDHVEELADEAVALDAGCVMAQPEFDPAIAGDFAAAAGLDVVPMDPLFFDSTGLAAYFDMMRALPKAVAACAP